MRLVRDDTKAYESVTYCGLCGEVIFRYDPDESFEDALKRYMVRAITVDESIRGAMEALYGRAEAEAVVHMKARHPWRWRAWRRLRWAWLLGGRR